VATHTTAHQPSPALYFETITAYQRSAALKAALDIDLFTPVADEPKTFAEIARHCQASERGVRILCDYLTVIGFLRKQDSKYQATPDSALFLSKSSPGYIGASANFLLADEHVNAFSTLTESVKKGGTTWNEHGSLEPEHPFWIEFAHSMAKTTTMSATQIAKALKLPVDSPSKVLDIAASHGMFGITVAREYPQAHVVAVDWANVLEAARHNAQKFGVADRMTLLPGDAFEVELGNSYDAVLLTNILHHFDVPGCERMLHRMSQALKPGGQVVILEFVPNDDRVTPPISAMFSLSMLASTPKGDAYTFSQYQEMLRNTGFEEAEVHPLNPGFQQLVLAKRRKEALKAA
jgi:ubiquinone/menaquinone biosynthesis C-methylase UbiE